MTGYIIMMSAGLVLQLGAMAGIMVSNKIVETNEYETQKLTVIDRETGETVLETGRPFHSKRWKIIKR